MYAITRQHALDDLNPVLGTNLPNDLPHAQPNIASQFLEPVFGDPHQMIPMVKSAVLAFVVLHNHTLQKNEPKSLAGGSFFWRV